MTEIQNVQRLRVWSESTFAGDGTGTIANFTDVPFREGSMQVVLTTDSIDPQQDVQSRYEYREEVLGKKSGTIAFTVNLAPTGTAATTAQVAITSALGRLLKATFGAETLAAGSTASTGCTATVINVQTGHGSRWANGGAMGRVNAAGQLETQEVEDVDGDEVTLKHAFSAAPASTDKLYNCATYSFTEDPSESLQFLVQGVDAQDCWLLLGCQAVGGVTVAIDVTGAALPAVTFNFTAADWKTQAQMAAAPSSIGTASFTAYEPIVGHAGSLRVFTVGASTLTTSSLVHASALSFAPKIVFVPVTSPNGTNTVYRWRAGRAAPPCEGSFTPFFDDLRWWDARDNKTDKAVFYQAGITPGGAFLMSAPTVQITNPQRTVSGDEIAGQTVTWKARRDTDTAGSSAALAKSPFRIHLF